MDLQFEHAPQTVTIAAGDLHVVFSRRGDRYGHEVWCARGEERMLLASVEGAAEDPWPPSPPFQELHVEQRGDKQVALLVGRAGRSHWSLSVEPDLADGSLVFDVACRSAAAMGWLGSTYRIVDADAARSLGNGRFLFASGYELHVSAGGVEAEQAGEERRLRIAARAEHSHAPQTVRWRYRLAPIAPCI
ncbi:MAG TPA: hypothetical protein VNH11_10710 [Pirellulales bacterium]|nr:hypothetical protein [Pirellulales bacterium]